MTLLPISILFKQNLSFGTRQIWACDWSDTRKRLAIGSVGNAYILDPESRGVNVIPTERQDVLSMNFAKSTSSGYNLFMGCRDGSVKMSDFRAPLGAISVVKKKQFYNTSIKTVLCSPIDPNLLIVSDMIGTV